MKRCIFTLTLCALASTALADPQLTSWFTANSGRYARLYTSAANETTGPSASSTSWSRGSGVQTNPAYADVNEINYSSSWVYIRTTGLASHYMGPWYLDAAKTTNFPNFPSNTAMVYRIPRSPTIPGTRILTGNGPIGRFVNGVSFFDNRDAFSYFTATSTEANPGDGVWNRDAYVNEGVTFDAALAHQAGNNYHYHVQPIALRYQLGDHVSYNATTNRYTEAVTTPVHSPIIAWAADGNPIYGPYGYSDPTNAASGVRRMISGYTLRDGTLGTTNLTTAHRYTLPAWAAAAQNRSATLTASQYGPDVSTSYPLGRYIEDNDFLGDLGYTQTTGATVQNFDLDKYNGRICVTPDYATPHYCYFTAIKADGTPTYPYNIGRQFYGNPTGGATTAAVMIADTPLTQQFIGGANTHLTINAPGVSGSTVTLTWSAVEGGTYSVDASPNQSTWTPKGTGIVAPTNSATTNYTALSASGTEYGRVTRTALPVYDSNGQTAATVSQSSTASYPVTPNTPPTISAVANVSTMKNNATTALSFTIGDGESPASGLTMSASSSNTALVPLANIVFGGSDVNRTVTVTPASGQVGTATITITVSDGTTTTSTSFDVTVKPPNILLIIADDYGIDASSLYNTAPGAQLPQTPNIATLASNGIKFANAYAYTLCSPARSSILTGRQGFRTGTANVVGGGTSNNALKAAEFTLPEAFTANPLLQFQLKHVGKWHLGGGNTAPCLIGGWSSFAGAMTGEIEDFYAWTKVTGSGASASSTTSTTYATTENVNDALAFISTQTSAGKPWFTWLAFNAPHIPYHKPPSALCVTPSYAALSGTTADITANPLNYCNASIEAMDTEIGRLLAGVNLNTTTVIFIGDNGTPSNVLQTPFPSNHGKATLYEGGVRVPMLIRGPDVVSPGRTATQLVHITDLFSTILETAGINVASTVPAGTTLDSKSLMPVIQNTAGTRTQVFEDYWDLGFPTLAGTGRSLRDSQYKLIRLASGTDLFFDLAADPYETTNLVGSMNAAQTTAYNNLVTQLGSYNTPPTIGTVANQSVPVGTSTSALPFTLGDAELNTSILTVSTASSNTVLVPAGNVVVGGTGTSRTVTATPAAGLVGTSTITLTVNDGVFTTSSSFVLTVGASASVGTASTNPATPTNTDATVVTAAVSPGSGATLSSVQLQYSTGAQTSAPVFREIFANGSTTGTTTGTIIPGNMNSWTGTATRAAADVKLRGSIGNHTLPIVLSNCTTNGSTTVTCASTTGLIPGMSLSGTNIAASTTISSVTNGTTFVISPAASGSGSALSLTAAGVSLTGCSLGTSPTINTANTTGLVTGMGITGTGLTTNPPNPAVLAVTSGTSFTVNSTVTAVPATLTASGCGLEFANGTATDTATMVETTSAINAGSASAGNIEFYVRNADLAAGHGWTLDIFDGTTWQPRMSETYAGSSATCDLTANSTTIACTDTSKLTQGNVVQGSPVSLTGCTTVGPTPGPATAVVTCANTTGLQVGMFLTGNGIPNNTRVTAITANTNFTMSNVATASGTVNVIANYLNANTTITAINPNVSFTVSTAPVLTVSGVVLSSVNHSFALKHYDLIAADRNAGMKMRFRWAGGTAAAPLRPPTCDIDDIIVTLTTGSAPQTVAMFDDGLHGDGAASDGVYGATIPAQSAGTTVSYTITATDSASGTANASGSYTVATAAPVLAVTPATTLSSAGAAGSSNYSPSSITYTLTNSGTGTMSWTAGKTAAWLNLSSTAGTLAAGASTTVTASINPVNANSLTAATYNDTITFTNTNSGTGNTTRAASLLITNGTPTVPPVPVITSLPAYSYGTSKTITWPTIATATGYTVQIATNAAFTTNVVSQNVSTPTASFLNLTHGVTYYYRVLASNSIGSSNYSTAVSSTQDAVAPVISVTSPANGTSTATNTLTVTGTSSDALSGVSTVKVNNVTATSANGFANWTVTIPLGFGTNAITATAFDGVGNLTTSTAITATLTTAQTYNPLVIPDIITGTTFNLVLNQTSRQFPALGPKTPALLGSATTTLGYNGALMWGPTLIMNKGDYIQLNVKNNLDQSASPLLRTTTTTVHWHGLHIPAIMDGGPRQVIPGGTTWSPSFTMMNNAATYWYHPHLHVATQEQLTLGAGGFIIVRDPEEVALGLPRTYGVDDIPLAITSRRFLNPTNQFSFNQYAENGGTTSSLDNYGDYILINGTLSPQVSLPKQYVRLRILNGEIQRGYNLGFSDNRTFYVIGNDQGLLNAPVAVTRMFLMVGERVEILVNMSSDTASFDLMAYNSGQSFGFPSQEGPAGGTTPTGNAGPENGSRLNNSDFAMLRINPVTSTPGAITTLPATLVNNTYWTAGNVTNTRTIAVTGGNATTVNGITSSTGFSFDSKSYSPGYINHTIPINAIERWNMSAGNVFGHSLHIHDIKFNILARYIGTPATPGTQVTTNGLAAPYESGWKDTVYIPRGESVSLLMKFDDFASNDNPYMFHCHFMNHEDGGMMGQFLVVNNAVEDLSVASFTRYGANNQIDLDFKTTPGTTYNLQYSADMSTWTTIGSVTSDGTSAGFTETDTSRLGQPKGFYRVVLPTAPAAPVITSAATATGSVGSAFSYQITASNTPTSFIATGLPAGLTLNSATGLISGTPTTAATTNVTFTATNAGGTGEGHFVLTVN